MKYPAPPERRGPGARIELAGGMALGMFLGAALVAVGRQEFGFACFFALVVASLGWVLWEVVR